MKKLLKKDKNKDKSCEKVSLWLHFAVFTFVFAIFTSSLYPLVKIAIYSRPAVDDFAYSNGVHAIITTGKWNVISVLKQALITDINFYKTWQGLYSSAFILALQPGVIGEKYYCVGAWTLMLLIFASMYFFVNTVCKLLKIFSSQERFYAVCVNMCVSIGLTAILLAGLPSSIEGIYWFNGAWNYMPFFCLTMVNISLCLRYSFLSSKNCLALSTIVSFVISGGHPILGLLNLMLLSLFVVADTIHYKKLTAVMLPWVSATVGFAVMLMAPGTKLRVLHHINDLGIKQPTLLQTITKCAGAFFEFTIHWVANWHYCCYIILVALIAYLVQLQKRYTPNDFKIHPRNTFCILYVVICGMLCVPYMAFGTHFGAPRGINVIWCTFMILSGIACFYSVLWLLARVKIKEISKSNMLAIMPCLIALCYFSVFFDNSNSVVALREIRDGTAQNFANAWDKRLVLARSGGLESLEVDALPNSKILYYVDDIYIGWNKTFQDYYGGRLLVPKK